MTDVEACLASLRNNPECGRELKVSELQERIIYILWKETKPEAAATMWCKNVGRGTVTFWAGGVYLTLVLFRQPDDTLKDDSGLRVRVFEYLGKP